MQAQEQHLPTSKQAHTKERDQTLAQTPPFRPIQGHFRLPPDKARPSGSIGPSVSGKGCLFPVLRRCSSTALVLGGGTEQMLWIAAWWPELWASLAAAAAMLFGTHSIHLNSALPSLPSTLTPKRWGANRAGGPVSSHRNQIQTWVFPTPLSCFSSEEARGSPHGQHHHHWGFELPALSEATQVQQFFPIA